MVEIIPIETFSLARQERRVKKFVLVWCAEGQIDLEVDKMGFTLFANQVITITSGQVHQVRESSNAKGMVLQFTYDFFCKDDKDIELVFHNGLFCHFDRNEIIDITEHQNIGTQLNLIHRELTEKPYQYLISIHSRIEIILVEINRAKITLGDEIWKPDALFLKFLELVRANFQYNHPLSHYAQELLCTELKLNELAKLHTGKTAQQVIQGLIISEAQRLFFYENLSVKEAAFALGFSDPFYFSNFFKKHTALSPKAFKAQLETK